MLKDFPIHATAAAVDLDRARQWYGYAHRSRHCGASGRGVAFEDNTLEPSEVL